MNPAHLLASMVIVLLCGFVLAEAKRR